MPKQSEKKQSSKYDFHYGDDFYYTSPEHFSVTNSGNSKFLFSVYVYQLETCCAVMTFTQWTINCTNKELNEIVSDKRFRKAMNKLRDGCGLVMATIPDADRCNKWLIKALKANGWKCVSKTKSHHGNYNVHMLVSKYRKTKRRDW